MKLTSKTSVFLDLVRGLSAQMVLIGHLFSMYGIYGFDEAAHQFNIQNFGVTIFFILSGFLIAYSVNNKGPQYNFKFYFIDRFSRIFIAFLPSLFFIVLIDFTAFYIFTDYEFMGNVNFKTFLGNLLMLQDFPLLQYFNLKFPSSGLHITSLGSARPLWTVAIEWWLYMYFGFLVFKKFTLRNSIIWIALLIVPLFNMVGRGNGLTLIWFTGAIIFYIIKGEYFKISFSWKLIFILLAASVTRLLLNNLKVYDLAFLLPIAFIFYLFTKRTQETGQDKSQLFRFKSFSRWLAMYSFSLYLLHYSIIIFILKFDTDINIYLEMSISFLISNIISFLFALITEYKYPELRKMIKKKLQYDVSNNIQTRTELVDKMAKVK